MDVPGYLANELKPAKRAALFASPNPAVTLGDAIMDLPKLAAADGAQEMDYDLPRRAHHTGSNNHHFIHRILEVSRAEKLTAHDSRPHSARDLRDFAKLREGENCKQAMEKRGEDFEFPYDRENFKDRYTRQHRDRPCSTIVAHLSKDGLMFIHPTQNRSLTPREAARVQTFPDWFQFPIARTHQFRVIGNAVPPLIGEAVGEAIAQFLESAATLDSGGGSNVIAFKSASRTPTIPTSQEEALEWLSAIARLSRRELRQACATTFLQGWHALLYLYPGLHPDNAIDHGETTEIVETTVLDQLDLSKRYERSGWPVILEPFGHEAWRRYEAGQLTEEQFYCVDAQRAGLALNSMGRIAS